jgi:hypothetical protein
MMCIIVIAKPPYILFLLIFLFLKLDKRTKFIGVTIPVILMFIWLFLVSANLSIKVPGADLSYNSKLQVAHIVSHPFKFLGLFFNFDTNGIALVFRMIVGVLGHLDLQFPIDYYHTAYIITFIAFISTLNINLHDNIRFRLCLFGVAFITLLAVMTSQYVIWTPLYIIPILPFLALSIAFSIKEEKVTKFRSWALIIILLFPILTSIVIADGIINRYYFK